MYSSRIPILRNKIENLLQIENPHLINIKISLLKFINKIEKSPDKLLEINKCLEFVKEKLVFIKYDRSILEEEITGEQSGKKRFPRIFSNFFKKKLEPTLDEPLSIAQLKQAENVLNKIIIELSNASVPLTSEELKSARVSDQSFIVIQNIKPKQKFAREFKTLKEIGEITFEELENQCKQHCHEFIVKRQKLKKEQLKQEHILAIIGEGRDELIGNLESEENLTEFEISEIEKPLQTILARARDLMITIPSEHKHPKDEKEFLSLLKHVGVKLLQEYLEIPITASPKLYQRSCRNCLKATDYQVKRIYSMAHEQFLSDNDVDWHEHSELEKLIISHPKKVF